MKINSYSFGRIVINEKEYTNDVIILLTEVKSWWRKEGHEVCVQDIKEVVKARPELLIIGTGASGYVVVKEETEKFLASNKIELIAKPTQDACKLYNDLSESKRVVAALHLTC
ncbi:MAG: MTH938/NDUFAF3 family protein [Candidatus Aenigmarchaeota archaeon]|nr:MTH938/NDUFAF3 family protein [Candidatus Aenigmarchaeota archaeon]